MMRMLTLAALALALQSGTAPAAESRGCLRYHDLAAITKVDNQTLVAKVKGDGRYKILVNSRCRYLEWPQDYFVTRNTSPWECVRAGDALELNGGGNCFVHSVTPMDEPSAH